MRDVLVDDPKAWTTLLRNKDSTLRVLDETLRLIRFKQWKKNTKVHLRA